MVYHIIKNMKTIIRISAIILLCIPTLLMHSCLKKEVPTLETSTIKNITGTTATSGGSITDEGSGTVIAKGLCWSTDKTPAIANSKTYDGSGTGSFTSNMTGLDGGTTYYFRAYATNSAGTGYGMAMSFTTLGQVPSVSTGMATNVTTNEALLHGIVNANYLTTLETMGFGGRLLSMMV